jgi:protein-tyrosine phosphatase
MARSFLLLILGVALCIIAFSDGVWTCLIGWLGVDFLILGIAYFRRFHHLFGKRPDGTLPLWGWILFLPLHLYSLVVLKLARSLGNEPWSNSVNEMLAVGSCPFACDNCANFEAIVDLTSEFQERKHVRQRPGYLSFPILDACAPNVDALLAAIKSLPKGRVFIHCAQGHGRTGLFAAACLLENHEATSADEALQLLKKTRPGIRLNRAQRRCLSEFEASLKRQQE